MALESNELADTVRHLAREDEVTAALASAAGGAVGSSSRFDDPRTIGRCIVTGDSLADVIVSRAFAGLSSGTGARGSGASGGGQVGGKKLTLDMSPPRTAPGAAVIHYGLNPVLEVRPVTRIVSRDGAEGGAHVIAPLAHVEKGRVGRRSTQHMVPGTDLTQGGGVGGNMSMMHEPSQVAGPPLENEDGGEWGRGRGSTGGGGYSPYRSHIDGGGGVDDWDRESKEDRYEGPFETKEFTVRTLIDAMSGDPSKDGGQKGGGDGGYGDEYGECGKLATGTITGPNGEVLDDATVTGKELQRHIDVAARRVRERTELVDLTDRAHVNKLVKVAQRAYYRIVVRGGAERRSSGARRCRCRAFTSRCRWWWWWWWWWVS